MCLDVVAKEYVEEVIEKKLSILSVVLIGETDLNRNSYGDSNAEILYYFPLLDIG